MIFSSIRCSYKFISWKDYFLNVHQTVIDHWGHFIQVNVNWLSRVHDARIFRSSLLPDLMEQRESLPHGMLDIQGEGMTVSSLLIGDPAYPLHPSWWNCSQDAWKELLNKLSICRMAVRYAFRHLKARWSCLRICLDANEFEVPRFWSLNVCWKTSVRPRGSLYPRPCLCQLRQSHSQLL